MKFKFSYEKLLEHRKRIEEIAHRDYLAAAKLVHEAEDNLKLQYDLIDQARKSNHDFELHGQAKSPSLVLNSEFIIGQKTRIQTLKEKIRELMRDAEDKQQVFLEAAKEYKILLKLREKQLIAFHEKRKKHEAKTLDELVVTRYAKDGRL